MEVDKPLVVLALVLFLGQTDTVTAQFLGERVTCAVTTGTTLTNQIFKFRYRYGRGTITSIRQIAFYDSSVAAPDAMTPLITTPTNLCRDNTVDGNGVLEVGFDVNGDNALPCGIKRSGNAYTFTIAIGGPPYSASRFVCTTGSGGNIHQSPSTLTVTNFETSNLQDKMTYRQNTESVFFRIIQADGWKVPAFDAQLGRLLQLRAVLNKDTSLLNRKSDNLGTSFTAIFLEHDNSNIYLQISTPGLGTVVRVYGTLPGATFSTRYAVKRDEQTLVKIDGAYRQNAQSGNWTFTRRAVRVEVMVAGTVVGVKAISRLNSGSPPPTEEHTVLPDSALGTRYNCYTGMNFGRGSGQCIVYAVQDSTRVTISFRTFPIPANRFIDGVPFTATTTLRMHKDETLCIACNSDCHLITVSSAKPVGVVTGHESQKIRNTNPSRNHIVSQLPPVKTYGSQVVISPFYEYMIVLADPTISVTYTIGTGALTTSASGTFISSNTVAMVTFTTQKALLLAVPLNPTNPNRPFSVPFPALHQWTTRQYYYVRPGVSYRVVVLALTGEIPKIRIINEVMDSKFTLSPGYTETLVTGSTKYAYLITTMTPTESTLVEFRSGSRNKPFLVLMEPTVSNAWSSMALPFGIGLSAVNPCVPSPPDNNILFGQKIQTVPGDGEDNDCDGYFDEEINNGKDDGVDTDTNIDDDLAANAVSPYSGIYVSSLKASDNAGFSTSGGGVVVTLITNGCVASTATPRIKIEPFTWNQNLGHMYDAYHVVDTPPFEAYYINTPRIYFRIEIGLCRGELKGTKCENSCQSSGRRRRDADEIVTLETQLQLINVTDEHAEQTASDYGMPCQPSVLYWIPPLLLLLTLLVEAVVTIAFMLHRSALKKDM